MMKPVGSVLLRVGFRPKRNTQKSVGLEQLLARVELQTKSMELFDSSKSSPAVQEAHSAFWVFGRWGGLQMISH